MFPLVCPPGLGIYWLPFNDSPHPTILQTNKFVLERLLRFLQRLWVAYYGRLLLPLSKKRYLLAGVIATHLELLSLAEAEWICWLTFYITFSFVTCISYLNYLVAHPKNQPTTTIILFHRFVRTIYLQRTSTSDTTPSHPLVYRVRNWLWVPSIKLLKTVGAMNQKPHSFHASGF